MFDSKLFLDDLKLINETLHAPFPAIAEYEELDASAMALAGAVTECMKNKGNMLFEADLMEKYVFFVNAANKMIGKTEAEFEADGKLGIHGLESGVTMLAPGLANAELKNFKDIKKTLTSMKNNVEGLFSKKSLEEIKKSTKTAEKYKAEEAAKLKSYPDFSELAKKIGSYRPSARYGLNFFTKLVKNLGEMSKLEKSFYEDAKSQKERNIARRSMFFIEDKLLRDTEKYADWLKQTKGKEETDDLDKKKIEETLYYVESVKRELKRRAEKDGAALKRASAEKKPKKEYELPEKQDNIILNENSFDSENSFALENKNKDSFLIKNPQKLFDDSLDDEQENIKNDEEDEWSEPEPYEFTVRDIRSDIIEMLEAGKKNVYFGSKQYDRIISTAKQLAVYKDDYAKNPENTAKYLTMLQAEAKLNKQMDEYIARKREEIETDISNGNVPNFNSERRCELMRQLRTGLFKMREKDVSISPKAVLYGTLEIEQKRRDDEKNPLSYEDFRKSLITTLCLNSVKKTYEQQLAETKKIKDYEQRRAAVAEAEKGLAETMALKKIKENVDTLNKLLNGSLYDAAMKKDYKKYGGGAFKPVRSDGQAAKVLDALTRDYTTLEATLRSAKRAYMQAEKKGRNVEAEAANLKDARRMYDNFMLIPGVLGFNKEIKKMSNNHYYVFRTSQEVMDKVEQEQRDIEAYRTRFEKKDQRSKSKLSNAEAKEKSIKRKPDNKSFKSHM